MHNYFDIILLFLDCLYEDIKMFGNKILNYKNKFLNLDEES